MRKDIHPNYNKVTFKCSCGNEIKVGSTLKEDFEVEVCSACHPFYTGNQKIVDTGGRLSRFKDRFGSDD